MPRKLLDPRDRADLFWLELVQSFKDILGLTDPWQNFTPCHVTHIECLETCIEY